MAVPTTIPDFLVVVRKSGLCDDVELEALLAQPSTAELQEPRQLAIVLVRNGLITPFQAAKLLQGKWNGFTIGKYLVLECVGKGGMGSVFLCRHTLMHRLVALKILPLGQTKDASAIERFYREARALGALDHPNIVRAHDVDRIGKHHFLVMEFADGASLEHLVSSHGPLSIGRAGDFVRQTALGLQHAHQAGWVHRDIKPSNLLLDRNGTVKILDMGLARLFHDQKDNLTRNLDDKCILGTADYIAPEQAMDSHEVDIRADIYSLGATFYFLLSGKPPFGDGILAQKLLCHQLKEPKPIQALRPEVPEPLAAALSKMMAKSPEKRFQEPLEVAEAMSAWALPPAPPSESEVPKRCTLVSRLCRSDTTLRLPAGLVLPTGARSANEGTATAVLRPQVLQNSSAITVARLTSRTSETPRPLAAPPRIRRVLLIVSLILLSGGGLGVAGLAAFYFTSTPKVTPIEEPESTEANDGPPLPVEVGVLTSDAGKYVGKKCVVKMEVKGSGLSAARTIAFLNSEVNYRDPKTFTVVIDQSHLASFHRDSLAEVIQEFAGKTIRVTGVISLYNNQPQVMVTDPQQIQIEDRASGS